MCFFQFASFSLWGGFRGGRPPCPAHRLMAGTELGEDLGVGPAEGPKIQNPKFLISRKKLDGDVLKLASPISVVLESFQMAMKAEMFELVAFKKLLRWLRCGKNFGETAVWWKWNPQNRVWGSISRIFRRGLVSLVAWKWRPEADTFLPYKNPWRCVFSESNFPTLKKWYSNSNQEQQHCHDNSHSEWH